ncbi:hypothetical protein [Sphingobium sp. Sx8-8]|uniref:hypothetical protein n=1 Tax=Sphingobium sp. Sx8-8 TaxID=2933617 RepID=UPI001F59C1F6|nr:hypothetical protein [Sphingobium sp. Sx8-8]
MREYGRMRKTSGLRRSSYAIITLCAALIAGVNHDESHGWPFLIGHFLIAWIIIAAFAMAGKGIARKYR